jgi:hypothetical protein
MPWRRSCQVRRPRRSPALRILNSAHGGHVTQNNRIEALSPRVHKGSDLSSTTADLIPFLPAASEHSPRRARSRAIDVTP